MPGDTISDADYHGDLPKIIDDGINNNYGDWRKKAYLQLLSWDLWKIIEGPESIPLPAPIFRAPHPDDPDNADDPDGLYGTTDKAEFDRKSKEAKLWMTVNNITLAKIGKAVPGDQFHIIDRIRYAKEAWQNLHDHYLPRNSLRSASLRTSILSNRCPLEADIGTWLNDMQRLYKLYNMLGDMDPGSLSQHAFTLVVLDNMPAEPSWLEYACKLKNKVLKYEQSIPPIPIDSKYFITKIREQWWLRAQIAPQNNSHVFTARTDSDKKTLKRPYSSDESQTNTSKRARPANDKMCTNPNCARKGHLFTECFTFGGGNQGNYPAWWKGPWNLHISPSLRARANNVPPASHPAFARLSAAAHAIVTNDDSTRATTSPHSPSSDDPVQIHAVLNQENPPSQTSLDDAIVSTFPLITGDAFSGDSCYYDSGATRHVFHDQTAFETYEEIPPLPVKGFGRDYSTVAIGRGSIRLQGHHGNSSPPITLSNVLHIPAARSNLISGGILDRAGISATTRGGIITLSYNGANILQAKITNGMYKLNASIIRPTPKPPLLSRITLSETSTNTASPASEDFYTALWDI
jgi:hypothetical protein